MKLGRIRWDVGEFLAEDEADCTGCGQQIIGHARMAMAVGMTPDEPDDLLGTFHVGCEP